MVIESHFYYIGLIFFCFLTLLKCRESKVGPCLIIDFTKEIHGGDTVNIYYVHSIADITLEKWENDTITHKVLKSNCSSYYDGTYKSQSVYYLISSLKPFNGYLYFHENINWELLNEETTHAYVIVRDKEFSEVKFKNLKKERESKSISFDCLSLE